MFLAYEKILTCMRKDSSVSPSSEESNYHRLSLTSSAFSALLTARNYIHINHSILHKVGEWISQQQHENGCFCYSFFCHLVTILILKMLKLLLIVVILGLSMG